MGPLRNFELKQHKFTTTYVKLQQAYAAESNAAGGATSSTNNFNYKDATGFSNNTVALTSSASIVGFTAGNKAKLNDCAIGDHWKITVTAGSAAGEATFTPSTLTQDCLQLTPNFSQIGK